MNTSKQNKSEKARLPRLIALLILLQSKRVITASDIAEKFDISKRTAYRDIKTLEEAGVPIYTIEGKGYSILDGYTLPPVAFTEEEANALITAEKMISRNKDRSLVENHNNAITKVKAVLRFVNKDKVEMLENRVAFLKNFGSYTTSSSLATVQLAITNRKTLRIKYHSISKEETTFRNIEAQALYHTKENWILIAWCQMRLDFREFRLDKILTLEWTGRAFENRKFDLMGYFMRNQEKKVKN